MNLAMFKSQHHRNGDKWVLLCKFNNSDRETRLHIFSQATLNKVNQAWKD